MEEKKPLKVCYYCTFWSPKLKGLCGKTGQGVGKFWFCKDWTKKADNKS